ncbi:unnamed protein product [Spirodela intermedia]|uniref:Uncharacterized protein n=1 Tax=Spirodela intermedia TaxID=51605 RepID=A0A7I8KZT4_SPIIN|nr:unnamed protein product [Spirodela intermedia]
MGEQGARGEVAVVRGDGAVVVREATGKTSAGVTSPPRLCYHALPNQRPEPVGMMTPPPQAPGRVPFRWEEAPGKPRNSNNCGGTKPASARGLELPPRLAVLSSSSSSSSAWQVAKVADAEVPSKTVLEGTYYVLLGPPASQIDGMSVTGQRSPLSCSSFAFGQRSLRFYSKGDGRRRKQRSGGWFWKRTAPKRSGGDSSSQKAPEAAACLPRSYSHGCGFYVDEREEDVEGEAAAAKATITRHARSRSLPSLSTATSHLWASIYGSLKQAVAGPWTSRKPTTRRWPRDSLR